MRGNPRVRLAMLAVAGLSATPSAWGYELSRMREATQSQFHDMASDLTAVIGDKTLLASGNSGGPWSWGMGGVASTTFLHSSGTWESVIGLDADHLDTAGFAAYVNLLNAVQVGMSAISLASTDDAIYSVDAMLPLLKGAPSGIAVTARGSFSAVTSVEDFRMFTQSLELLASKAYGPWTPYLGVGVVAGQFDGRHEVELDSENLVRPKVYAGANWTLSLFDLAGEVEQTGHNTSLSLRINVRF